MQEGWQRLLAINTHIVHFHRNSVNYKSNSTRPRPPAAPEELQPGTSEDAIITIVAPDCPFIDGDTLVPAVVNMGGVKYAAGITALDVINRIPNVAPLAICLTTATEETIDAIAEAAARPFHADIVYGVQGRLLILTSLQPRA